MRDLAARCSDPAASCGTPAGQRASRVRRRDARPGLGRRLRSRRQALGLKQVELAEAAGTTQAVVQKIENGHSLHPRCIEALADVLRISPAALLFGESTELPRDVARFGARLALVSDARRGQLLAMLDRTLDAMGVAE